MKPVLIVLLVCCIQSSSASADVGRTFDLTLAPDIATHCHQYRADIKTGEYGSVGAMLAYDCRNRQDRPIDGSMTMNSQVSNTFNRVMIPFRYAPHGIFGNGYFVEVMLGAEHAEYRSAAGSSENVSFLIASVGAGYQWFWRNGANISVFAGLAHLANRRRDAYIVASESADVRDYLEQQGSSNTHLASGVLIGWAF